MRLVLQDEDIMVRSPPENMAGKWATGRWLGMEEKRPYVPGLSSQGWQVMLPTASLSVRFRDGLLTCDASNAEAEAANVRAWHRGEQRTVAARDKQRI